MCLITVRREAVDLTDLQKWAIRAEKMRRSDYWSQKEDIDGRGEKKTERKKNGINALLQKVWLIFILKSTCYDSLLIMKAKNGHNY